MRVLLHARLLRETVRTRRLRRILRHLRRRTACNTSGQCVSGYIELGRASAPQAEEPNIRTPDFHGWDPLGADSAWFREFRRDVSLDPADPNSDQMLARLRNANGSIDAQWSGSWTPSDYGWYTFPFQVVSGDTAALSIPGTWAYSSDSHSYLLPPEPVVFEGSTSTKYATSAWSDGGDHHMVVFVRDEATGGLKNLWEYYQPWVTKTAAGQISAVSGASWRKFDLAHGENPVAGTGATDAAGMMILPLSVRYDEVARGSLNHALRFCVNNSDISPTYKWPARTAAGAWNPATGMPYGTRLRIKALWWSANADTVLGTSTQARIIGEAIRRYGLILADGSGGSTIQLQGVADMRWEKDLTTRLDSIPVTALEVVSRRPCCRSPARPSCRWVRRGHGRSPLCQTNPRLAGATSIFGIRTASRSNMRWHRSTRPIAALSSVTPLTSQASTRSSRTRIGTPGSGVFRSP